MHDSHNLDALRRVIADQTGDLESLLFVWLAGEPSTEREFVEVSRDLMGASKENLAHLVVARGLAKFPKSDALAVACLRLEMLSLRFAA